MLALLVRHIYNAPTEHSSHQGERQATIELLERVVSFGQHGFQRRKHAFERPAQSRLHDTLGHVHRKEDASC